MFKVFLKSFDVLGLVRVRLQLLLVQLRGSCGGGTGVRGGPLGVALHPGSSLALWLRGLQAAWGKPVRARYRFHKAEVVVALDSDFLATEGDAVAVLYTFDPNLGWMATSIGMHVSHGAPR